MTDWWAVGAILLGVAALAFVAAWQWTGDLETLAAVAAEQVDAWGESARGLPDQARQAWSDMVAWAEGTFEDLRRLIDDD